MSQNPYFLNKKINISDQDILKGIIEDNDMVIRYIYKQFFPGIKALVRSFRHLHLDADDVFQEGLTRAIINIKAGKFRGKSTFYTYLNSICYHVCLKDLKSSQSEYPLMDNIPDHELLAHDEQDIFHLLLDLKGKMDPSCCQIIDVRFGLGQEKDPDQVQLGHHHNLKFEEIGKILGIEPDNARQRFKRCMEKLREMLFSHPDWAENI